MKIFKKDGTSDPVNEKGWNGFPGLRAGPDIQAGILAAKNKCHKSGVHTTW